MNSFQPSWFPDNHVQRPLALDSGAFFSRRQWEQPDARFRSTHRIQRGTVCSKLHPPPRVLTNSHQSPNKSLPGHSEPVHTSSWGLQAWNTARPRLLTEGRPGPPPLDAFPALLAAKCPSKKAPQMWSWGLAVIPGEGSFSGAPSLIEARLPAVNLSFVYFQAIKNDSLISLL